MTEDKQRTELKEEFMGLYSRHGLYPYGVAVIVLPGLGEFHTDIRVGRGGRRI